MNDDRLHDLLGAYAIGAVDDDERAAVEALLARSPEARRELARLEHAVAALTDAEATRMPPEGAFDRLLGALRADDDSDLDLDATAGPDALPPLRLPPPDGGEPQGVVVPLASRRRWGPRVLAAAASIAVAALAATVVVQQRRLDDRGNASVVDRAQAALTADGSRVGTLASDDGSLRVRAVVAPDGAGYLFADQLPALADGRTYQLWTVDGPAPVSLGVLGDRPRVVAFPAGVDVTTLAITDEPVPGSTGPTSTPLVVGKLAR